MVDENASKQPMEGEVANMGPGNPDDKPVEVPKDERA